MPQESFRPARPMSGSRPSPRPMSGSRPSPRPSPRPMSGRHPSPRPMSPRPSGHPFRSRRFPQRQYYLDNWNRYYYPGVYGVPVYVDDLDDDIIVVETPLQQEFSSPKFQSGISNSTLNLLIGIAVVIVALFVLFGLVLAML